MSATWSLVGQCFSECFTRCIRSGSLCVLQKLCAELVLCPMPICYCGTDNWCWSDLRVSSSQASWFWITSAGQCLCTIVSSYSLQDVVWMLSPMISLQMPASLIQRWIIRLLCAALRFIVIVWVIDVLSSKLSSLGNEFMFAWTFFEKLFPN